MEQTVIGVSVDPQLGLSREQVAERTAQGRVNVVTAQAGRTEKQIVWQHILTFFNFIFVALAAVLVVCGCSVKNMTFLIILVINAVIGIFQEIRAKRAVDKLSLVTARQVNVIRDGETAAVPSWELVEDDIVAFFAGDQICADGILAQGELFVNEALLTGEQDVITKKPGDSLLSGSFVVAGEGRAQLTKVGDESFAAQLTREAKADPRAAKSEMMRSLDKLVKVMGILLIPVGIGMFIHQYYVIQPSLSLSAQATVAALVGMIPEGLYLLTSIALAASALLLTQKKVLVQDMNCIETLARVDVLCVDKTGTITEPEMKLQEVRYLNGRDAAEVRLALGALYAGRTPDNDTAQALAAAFPEQTDWECKNYIPFTSQTKWCGGVFAQGTFLAGAPECLLREKYEALRHEIEAENRLGNRVLLLVSYKGDPEEPLQDAFAEPMALLILTNPIRENAVKTFAYFAQQGVTIKVISGDNPQTVSAVAMQAQIEGAENYIDARTLTTDEDIYRAAEQYTVFGRVTPEQKKKLIKALKEQGHTVAMTGDGVNDVLAMKQADCGVAMASGAAACSQVAQLVLTKSDFGAMPYIVGEGRRVINNIQRAAALFLVKNIMSLFVALLTMAIGFAYPFQPIQMTMISALTIGVPAFFFAMEPSYRRVEGKFLPTVLRNALPGGLTNVLAVIFAQRFLTAQGVAEADISTLCVTVLSTVGLLVLLQVSRPVSPFRLLVLGAMGVAMAGCFLIPFLSVIFDLGILELACLKHLWVILPVAAGIFLALTGVFLLLDKIFGKK